MPTKPTTTEVEVTQEDWFVRNADLRNPDAHIIKNPGYFAEECAAAIRAGTLRRTSPEAGEHPLARMVRLDEEMGLYDTDEKVPPADPLDCAAARRARFRKHIDDRLGPSTANAPDVRNPADLIALLHSRLARLEEAGDRMAEALEYLVSLGGGDCLDPARSALTDWRAVREGG